MKISQLYHTLDTQIPASLSCPWDNDGLAVCPDPDAAVTGIVVALDVTDDVIRKAEETGSNVILTHHPLLFGGIKSVVSAPADPRADRVIRLIQKGISAMAFHTRLDTLDGGVNDILATFLGLEDTLPFGDSDNPRGKPMGRMGSFPSPMSAEELATLCKQRLRAPSVSFTDGGRPISKVAVLGGSGGDEIYAAICAGADALVTGEAKHHHFCDAIDSGLTLVAAGHSSTEHPVCALLALMAGEICHAAGEEIPVFPMGQLPIRGI